MKFIGLVPKARNTNLIKHHRSLNFTNCITSRRFLAIDHSFNQNVEKLKSKIDAIEGNNDPVLALKVLNECHQLQQDVRKYDKLDFDNKSSQISRLTHTVLNEKVKIDNKFLAEYWKLFPSFQDVIISIDSFYSQSKTNVIEKDVVLIPFRKLIFDGELQNAIKLVDFTVASDRYLKTQDDKRKTGLFKYFFSFFGVIGSIEALVRLMGSQLAGELVPVYCLILAYVGNMSFLASMLFSSKKTENLLKFDTGTFQKYWYQHSDELQLMNRIVELDLKLNDKDQSSFVSKEIVDNLAKRKIVYNEPEQEIMLRQYWLSGGDGFVWVEPDQDPADLIWEQHLKDLKILNLTEKDEKLTE